MNQRALVMASEAKPSSPAVIVSLPEGAAKRDRWMASLRSP
jgi:hypothetical protein